jgi:hypothetical protein
MSAGSGLNADEIYRRLRFYPADEKRQAIHTLARSLTIDYATNLLGLIPDSREKSEVMTLIESALMWANAGIARN